MIGSIVGNYRILRELGAGGMGVVYEGVDVMVERPVAIKMLRAEIARQPELIERFHSEAITLARLSHPSIAGLYSFFRDGDDYYMVMEFVRGATLEAMLKESGPLAPELASSILRQTLDGVAHAHRLGVLHRDIKPANIMITPDGAVKVTDFGIARILGASRMTREGRIVGTLEYLAPERIRGEEADIRSDLYSTGVVLYETLAGRLPFISDTDYGLIQAHLMQAPPLLAALGVNCPPEYEAIVAKALAKSPQDRFQSAEEFRDALAAPPVSTASVSLPPPPPYLEPTWLAPPSPYLPETRLAGVPARRVPLEWMIGGAAAVVVVLIGLFAMVFLRREAAPRQTAAAQPAASAPAASQPAPEPAPPPELPPAVAKALRSPSGAVPKAAPLATPSSSTTSSAPITLRQVHKLYVESMPNHLDRYIKEEIAKQMYGRLRVVAAREDADAVMKGKAEDRSTASSKVTGGYLGMKDTTTGAASITDLDGTVTLWSSEAGDKTPVFGVLKRGGPKKVAERLVSSLKKAMGDR